MHSSFGDSSANDRPHKREHIERRRKSNRSATVSLPLPDFFSLTSAFTLFFGYCFLSPVIDRFFSSPFCLTRCTSTTSRAYRRCARVVAAWCCYRASWHARRLVDTACVGSDKNIMRLSLVRLVFSLITLYLLSSACPPTVPLFSMPLPQLVFSFITLHLALDWPWLPVSHLFPTVPSCLCLSDAA